MGNTKSMIIVEDRLKELFDYLPDMLGTKDGDNTKYPIIFKYGDVKELQSFLKLDKNKDNYPLIWLAYPYSEEHKRSKVSLNNLSLIIAVPSNTTMLNDQRLKETYKKVLIPLFDNIKELFRMGNIIRVGEIYNIIKYPNYSDTVDNKNTVLVIWDAMKITFDCVITDACLKTINF